MNTIEIAEILFELSRLYASKEKGAALPDGVLDTWKAGAIARSKLDLTLDRAILEHFSDHGITCFDDINRGMSYTNALHLLVSIFVECKALEFE